MSAAEVPFAGRKMTHECDAHHRKRLTAGHGWQLTASGYDDVAGEGDNGEKLASVGPGGEGRVGGADALLSVVATGFGTLFVKTSMDREPCQRFIDGVTLSLAAASPVREICAGNTKPFAGPRVNFG